MSTQATSWTHRPSVDGDRRAVKRRGNEQQRVLAGVPLFHDVPARHLRRLAELAAVTTFDEDAEIVKEGASGAIFYVIVDGAAKVTRGGRTIAKLGPGDFFGELSILTGTPRMARVVATATPTRCVTLSARGLRRVLAEEPKVALRLLENVARRLLVVERPPA